MSWARFDDLYDDNRKIKRAWRRDRAAVGLHAMAITYCSRHRTDGVVDIEWVEEKLHKTAERKRTLAVLIDLGLFERVDDEHWLVHDFLEYNPSAADAADRARDKAEAGRRGGLAKANAKQTASKPLAGARADAKHLPASKSTPVPSRPVPSPKASSDASDIQAVFDEWIAVTERTGATILSDKRRRLIRNALQHYPLTDVIDAVRGWRRSPHHRGENKDGTIYNDLELLLRDAEHVERFRDFERGGGANGSGNGRRNPNAGGPPTLADIQAAQRAREAA